MSTINYKSDGQIVFLTINSPPANALSTTILEDIDESLSKIEKENTVKAIVLQGEGRFFSAGADIKEFTSLQKSSDYASLSRKGQLLFERIEHFQVPVIAAIHGAALGGGLELAMACHMRIVGKTSKFGMPEINLGIIPGFAGTQRLPQLVGMPKAYEMLLTGALISGEEAHLYGLANQVCADDEVHAEAEKLAKVIAQKSMLSINKVMELVPYAKNSQFNEGAEAEAVAFGNIFGTEDASEGIAAFLEKRTPHFRDK